MTLTIQFIRVNTLKIGQGIFKIKESKLKTLGLTFGLLLAHCTILFSVASRAFHINIGLVVEWYGRPII